MYLLVIKSHRSIKREAITWIERNELESRCKRIWITRNI